MSRDLVFSITVKSNVRPLQDEQRLGFASRVEARSCSNKLNSLA